MNVPGQTPQGKAPSAPMPLARPARLRSAPCHRLESVAFQILEDAGSSDFRRHLKYSPLAIVEKVVFRRQSVASCGRAPSYLWMTLQLDEDGVPRPEIDFGHMPFSVNSAPTIHKWGPLKGQPDKSRRSLRVNMPAHECETLGVWTLLTGDALFAPERGANDFMLATGLTIGTPFLARVYVLYSSSEDGEVDCDIETDILFIDSAPAHAFLPIALDDTMATAIGGRAGSPAKWSIAP